MGVRRSRVSTSPTAYLPNSCERTNERTDGWDRGGSVAFSRCCAVCVVCHSRVSLLCSLSKAMKWTNRVGLWAMNPCVIVEAFLTDTCCSSGKVCLHRLFLRCFFLWWRLGPDGPYALHGVVLLLFVGFGSSEIYSPSSR